ncbi:hypothetical protein LJC14_06050 [Treponema sp. OttesenSCG-928-L16]|nr:hypothetical protein [Treponema sp. OttesenSCG-928-L16]
MKHEAKRIFPGLLRVLPLALSLAVCACSSEAAIQNIIGSGTEVPVFLGCQVTGRRDMVFRFSVPVEVVFLRFNPSVEVSAAAGGETVHVSFLEDPGEGERLTADMLVKDRGGNTLNVLVPFRTRNERMPEFVITELRTEYSKPRVEFVEFFTSTAGNLGALRLFIASSGTDTPVFEFPPAEVRAGEYIVLHLRTLENESVNETGNDLGVSGGNEASAQARDFWVPGSAKLLRKSDAVFFTDQDDRIIDAVLLSENPDAWWNKEELSLAASFVGEQGAWLQGEHPERNAPGPKDAVPAAGTTPTRTICRDESAADSNSALDWYICAASSASPGAQNSTKRYSP